MRSLRDRQSFIAATSQPLGSPTFILNAEPGKYEITAPEATLVAPPASELLVGVELVLRGERNDEGVIVEAVLPPWRRFLDELTDNPDAFWKLDPWQTEELIAGAWRENGFEVTLTPRSGVLNLDQKASKAYITTTSTFAPGVYKEFATVMPTRLELRNGPQLRDWLTRFVKR